MVLLPTPEAPEIIVASPRSGTVGEAAEAAPVDQLQQRCAPLHGVVGRAWRRCARRRARRGRSRVGPRSDVRGGGLGRTSSMLMPAPSLLVRRPARRGRRSGSAGASPPLARRSASSSSWSSSSGSSGSTASLISKRSSPRAPMSRPAFTMLVDRVAGALLVAGLVGGVRRTEALDVVDDVVAVDVHARVATGEPGTQSVAQVHQHERLLARPRDVVEQRREAAAGLGGGLPLPRDLAGAVDEQVEEEVVEPRTDQPLVLDEHAPVARVGAGADEALLEQRHEGVALAVLQPALVALQQRDRARVGVEVGVAVGLAGPVEVRRRCRVGVLAHARVLIGSRSRWVRSGSRSGSGSGVRGTAKVRRVPSGRTA